MTLFIKSSDPKMIANIEAKGYERSQYCNEGIYTLISGRKILLVNHVPYIEHKECESWEEFLKLL
jgi:hypothetical protein